MSETFDFQDDNGPVPAHRCPNGGGWVADTAWVSGNARVSGDAWVSGKARVSGIMRSDGHCFVAVPCADGERRVIAGCRYFTYAEAMKHWNKTRKGTPLGDETMAILEYYRSLGQL